MLQKNIIKDRLLISPVNHVWTPEPVEGSYYNTLCNMIRKNIEEGGDWTWLHNRINGKTLNASDFEILSKKFAVLFKNLGLERNDSIHLVVGNYNESYGAIGGMWILGGVASCGDVALDDQAIAGQLKDTGAKIVFCTEETVANVTKAVHAIESKSKKKVHIYGFGEVSGVVNVFDLIKDIDESLAPDPVVAKDPKKDICIIFWTSGTTGLPKGICHSHFTTHHFGGFVAKSQVKPNSPSVTTTCFFHVGGFFTGILALEKRMTYHHMFGPDFTLKILLDTIVEAQPGTVALGSHHYVQLAESDILDKVDPESLDSVTTLFPAGSAVPSSCEIKIKEKFRNLQGVLNGYGQTESGIATIGLGQASLGMVMPQYRVKIEDPDTGERCAPNQQGEICLKSPFLMQRYLKRPKETEEFFDFEGFGHTGDIGYYDAEGNLIYVDRMKELIKYKNNHVAPTEIEDLLQSHPDIIECLVYGKKDPYVQELISAVVVKKKNSKVTEKELKEFVNDRIKTDFKKIRGSIIFRDELPRNNVGKLVRRKMREWAENLENEA